MRQQASAVVFLCYLGPANHPIYLLVGQGHYGAPIASTIKIIKSPPPPPFPVNSEIPIVFPTLELVCSNIYMVGVP